MRITYRLFALTALVLGIAAPARGQGIWPPTPKGNYVAVSHLMPFDDDYGDDWRPYGGLSLEAGFQVGKNSTFRIEMPFGIAQGTDWTREGRAKETGIALGNPYVGISVSQGGRHVAELGLRLPVLDDEKDMSHNLMGLLPTHWVDRLGAVALKTMTLSAIARPAIAIGPGQFLRISAGWFIMFPTDSDGRDGEVFASYGPRLELVQRNVDINIGAEYLTWVTSGIKDASFGDLSFMQAVAGVQYRGRRVHPAIECRIPFGDNMTGMAGWMLGARLTVPIGK